jgi:hypothetical protein
LPLPLSPFREQIYWQDGVIMQGIVEVFRAIELNKEEEGLSVLRQFLSGLMCVTIPSEVLSKTVKHLCTLRPLCYPLEEYGGTLAPL